MTMQVFNAIAANLRRQFPSLSDAMILQKTGEIYQTMLAASIESAKLQLKIEQEQQKRLKETRNNLTIVEPRRNWSPWN